MTSPIETTVGDCRVGDTVSWSADSSLKLFISRMDWDNRTQRITITFVDQSRNHTYAPETYNMEVVIFSWSDEQPAPSAVEVEMAKERLLELTL